MAEKLDRPEGLQAADTQVGMPYTTGGDTFQDVPLDLVEQPTFAPGEYQEADLADIQHSLGRLDEVRAAAKDGTIDQLADNDPDARRIYDFFYGGEAIRLDWAGDHYEINGGKHRIALARELGLPNIPARTRV